MPGSNKTACEEQSHKSIFKSGALRLAAFLGLALCLLYTLASYERWRTFQYTTFDLAFYVQAIWGTLHGQWNLSLLGVPMLGNHADAIVFLLVPLFGFIPHPFLPVVIQNLVLALMVPAGWRYAKSLGFSDTQSLIAGLSLVLAPATGFAALHEFHPETMAAAFLLFMALARREGKYGRFWIWFLSALACKENIALLLGWWFLVEALLERGRGKQWILRWCLLPLTAAGGWTVLYLKVLAPLWNGGQVDFGALYGRLGNSLPELAASPLLRPDAFMDALSQSLQGNLLPGLLIPFFLLPLLRPRWLLIVAPLLAQHLLSFRSSEWTIFFHYAVPIVPMLWIGAIEGARRAPTVLLSGMLCACVLSSFYFGMPRFLAVGASPMDTALREEMLSRIPADSSVIAPLSFQSHLAKRKQLYSLHHLIKGLNTLGVSRYQPPAMVDAVLVDFNDRGTFNPEAGYYHPTMRTRTGEIIPSSDILAHTFFRDRHWRTESLGPVTLYFKSEGPDSSSVLAPLNDSLKFDASTELVAIELREKDGGVEIECDWRILAERSALPWMSLVLVGKDGEAIGRIPRGWCVPEATPCDRLWRDVWTIPALDFTGVREIRIEWIDHARSTADGAAGLMQNIPPVLSLTFPVSGEPSSR